MLVMVEKKKKGPGRPRKNPEGVSRAGVACNFYLSEEMNEAFLRYLESLDVEPEKSKVFRKAMAEFLEKRGFWSASKAAE